MRGPLPANEGNGGWCPNMHGDMKDVVNHVIAPDISVICGDAEESLAGCAVGRQRIVKTLPSRRIVGPIFCKPLVRTVNLESRW